MSGTSNKTVSAILFYRGFGIISSSSGKDARSTTWLSSTSSFVPLPPLEGPWHLPAGDDPAVNIRRNQLPSATLNNALEEALELVRTLAALLLLRHCCSAHLGGSQSPGDGTHHWAFVPSGFCIHYCALTTTRYHVCTSFLYSRITATFATYSVAVIKGRLLLAPSPLCFQKGCDWAVTKA